MNPLLNCLAYIQTFLKIIDKESNLVSLILNEPQLRLYNTIKEQWQQGKPVRIIILKARQMGFSTLTAAIIFWMAATAYNVRCLIVAHTDDTTKNLFQMMKRFFEFLPEKIRPMQKASNAQELVFDRPARYRGGGKGLGSSIRCATAGGEGIGRSFTLKALHLSEYAFWPGDKADTLLGLLQAVPEKPGTLVVIESTARGYDDFKKRWDKAVKDQREGKEGGYIPIFFAWFEMKDYRRRPPKGFTRTAEEEALSQTFGLDDWQLEWRRHAIDTLCGGDLNKFHQEYPATPDEAFIATGQCVFNKDALVLRREQVQPQWWERGMFQPEYDQRGRIATCKWVPDSKGPIRIRVKPEPGVPYVLSGDTAGTGSDFFAGHVLDNRTGQQVAVLHHQFGERMFAEQMYCLGMFYNKALIGVEVNYSTYPQMCLEELGYPNLYVREKLDTFTGKMADAYGFETTSVSRPLIIDGLKDVARYHLETIHDYDTLGEMLTFVYNRNWRPEAEAGEHDDLVMSLAIAHYIRSQQSTAVAAEPEEGGAEWTEDMWEDYRNGSRTERELMVKLWGQPKR